MRILTPVGVLVGSVLLFAAAGCQHGHHAYRERCDDDVVVIHQVDYHERWRGHRHGHDYHDYRGSQRYREHSHRDEYRGGRDRFERPHSRGR